MLLNEFETRDLEERVRTELRFRPDAKYREHSLLWWKRPFRLPKPWAVYALDTVNQEQIERTKEAVKGGLLAVTRPGEKLYALDWNHCAFLFDPRKDEEQRSEEQIEQMAPAVKKALLNAAAPGERLYAMDWYHCAFLYDPRKEEEQKNVKEADGDGKFRAAFPFYYPDGDYYFFLDESFRFGYLGHPWRKEIWVFGAELLPEIEKIAPSLGWRKLR